MPLLAAHWQHDRDIAVCAHPSVPRAVLRTWLPRALAADRGVQVIPVASRAHREDLSSKEGLRPDREEMGGFITVLL